MRRHLPVLLLGLTLSAPAWAGEIYRYVEGDGTIVYTNVRPTGPQAAKARRMTVRPAPRKTDRALALSTTQGALARYEQIIEQAAARYRVPANLVRAVMHAESNFDPQAVSDKGASGLMQLMPQTARELYVKDIFDERENIEGGTRYLRVLANQFDGDMVKMIAAYNAGPNAVEKYGGQVPPYAETQAYVRKVVQLYFQYKAQAKVAEREAR